MALSKGASGAPSRNLLPGCATQEGTARFRSRFGLHYPGHYRPWRDLWLCSIGIGTYLGDPNDAGDERYRAAITRAIELGTNVVDSAINYRHQRSERAVGEALTALIAAGVIQRDEMFVATKGGFLSFDSDEPQDPGAYFEETLIKPGFLKPDEVAAGCHAMSPAYLAHQIEVSRRNLGLETIDLYYVHNPETQLSQVSREDFYRRLQAAFAQLERAVAAGWIRAYGTATWNAYRVGQDARESVSLEEVLRIAERVGGKNHHFRAVQLPINLAMTEALSANNQRLDGYPVPLLRLSQAKNLMVFASASLLEGELLRQIPRELQERFKGLSTDAQRAIQFVRSTPGVTAALVGMGRPEHVEEDVGTAKVAPLSIEAYRALFSGPAS
jgi:aryl-alcohol dehydrogenase-like predicted oxidoreductase